MSNNLNEFDKEIQNYLIENEDEDLLHNHASPNNKVQHKDLSEMDSKYNKFHNTNNNKKSFVSEEISTDNAGFKKQPNNFSSASAMKKTKLQSESPNPNQINESKLKFMEYMDNVKENTDSYQKKLLELAQARVEIDNKNKKLSDLEKIKNILMEENE